MSLRRAYTLAEVVVSTAVVGVMLVAGLHAAVGARLGLLRVDDRAQGTMIAHTLLVEILRQAYADPDQTPLFGPEPGEAGATRRKFDDVDDYDGWVEGTLTDKDGDASGRSGWAWSVDVALVDPLTLNADPAPVAIELPAPVIAGGKLDQPAAVALLDTGVKCVTVTVYRSGAVVARVAALRTAAGVRAELRTDELVLPEAEEDQSGVTDVKVVKLKLKK